MVKGIYEIYAETMNKALEDDVITRDESRLLKSLRKSLGVSDDIHKKMEEVLRKKGKFVHEEDGDELGISSEIYPDLYHEAYKKAVTEALKDNKISQDEFRILAYLREAFEIPMKEHIKIEKTIRDEISKTYKPETLDVIRDRINYWIMIINKRIEEKTKN